MRTFLHLVALTFVSTLTISTAYAEDPGSSIIIGSEIDKTAEEKAAEEKEKAAMKAELEAQKKEMEELKGLYVDLKKKFDKEELEDEVLRKKEAEKQKVALEEIKVRFEETKLNEATPEQILILHEIALAGAEKLQTLGYGSDPEAKSLLKYMHDQLHAYDSGRASGEQEEAAQSSSYRATLGSALSEYTNAQLGAASEREALKVTIDAMTLIPANKRKGVQTGLIAGSGVLLLASGASLAFPRTENNPNGISQPVTTTLGVLTTTGLGATVVAFMGGQGQLIRDTSTAVYLNIAFADAMDQLVEHEAEAKKKEETCLTETKKLLDNDPVPSLESLLMVAKKLETCHDAASERMDAYKKAVTSLDNSRKKLDNAGGGIKLAPKNQGDGLIKKEEVVGKIEDFKTAVIDMMSHNRNAQQDATKVRVGIESIIMGRATRETSLKKQEGLLKELAKHTK